MIKHFAFTSGENFFKRNDVKKLSELDEDKHAKLLDLI